MILVDLFFEKGGFNSNNVCFMMFYVFLLINVFFFKDPILVIFVWVLFFLFYLGGEGGWIRFCF